MPLVRYDDPKKNQWNRFVDRAKNANFQHYRTYIEYHKHRFTDHSLMYVEHGNVVCLMPANEADGQLCSHQGLTFGGILLAPHIKLKQVMDFFDRLIPYAAGQGLKELVFKLQPHIYDQLPSEETHYALFRNGATVSSRQVSSVIDYGARLHYGKGRKWSLKKARQHPDLELSESDDYEAFMEIETSLLSAKYNAAPVHTAAEIRLLKEAFPENIRLFAVNKAGVMIGGVLAYIYDGVVKCQYIGSTEECRQLHGLDLLLDELINGRYAGCRYFDFGHSTLNKGSYLEETLLQNKESYGARAVCYDTYTIRL